MCIVRSKRLYIYLYLHHKECYVRTASILIFGQCYLEAITKKSVLLSFVVFSEMSKIKYQVHNLIYWTWLLDFAKFHIFFFDWPAQARILVGWMINFGYFRFHDDKQDFNGTQTLSLSLSFWTYNNSILIRNSLRPCQQVLMIILVLLSLRARSPGHV